PRRIDEGVEPGVIHYLEHAMREAPPVFVRLLTPGVLIRRRLRLRVEHALFDRGMEFLRGEDVIERLDRRLRTKAREIAIDVVLEAVAEKLRWRDFIYFRNIDPVDDLCPLILHISERPLEEFHDIWIAVGPHEELSDGADARTFQSVAIEESQVAIGSPSGGRCGHRIGRIVTGNDVEYGNGVGHGPRHRPADVAIEKQRDDAIAAGQSHG